MVVPSAIVITPLLRKRKPASRWNMAVQGNQRQCHCIVYVLGGTYEAFSLCLIFVFFKTSIRTLGRFSVMVSGALVQRYQSFIAILYWFLENMHVNDKTVLFIQMDGECLRNCNSCRSFAGGRYQKSRTAWRKLDLSPSTSGSGRCQTPNQVEMPRSTLPTAT